MHTLRIAIAFALALPAAAMAQSALIYGQLSNFDIANDTGQTCHGFQIDIDGLTQADIPTISFFTSNRYGQPSIVATATGVTVKWESPYDQASGTWAERTLPHTVAWFPGQCYQWVTTTYQDGGCEHYGVRPASNTGPSRARWLCEDPNAPGALIPVDPPTAVPASPNYFVQPPAVPANPPQLVIEVDAPEPAEAPNLFGDAQWERVYRVELSSPIPDLNALVADNPAVVPMDPASLESDYAILQQEPVAGGNGKRRQRRHQGDIAPTTRAVVRRIELWQFTGNYDPVTHEALCADGTCTTPAAGEVGNLISVQMTGANVLPDAIIVSKSGSGGGAVSSADKILTCGSKCAGSYTNGQLATLSAKADSNSNFIGWSGACSGAGTCTVAVNGPVDVGAQFDLKPVIDTLSVGRSNPGTVNATPNGLDRALSCGKDCSAKFASGTQVTLTATPPDGKSFVSWGGACSGTAPICTTTMNANLSVQANFSK